MVELVDVRTKRQKQHEPPLEVEPTPAHPFIFSLRKSVFRDVMVLPQPLPSGSAWPQEATPGAWAHGYNVSMDSSELSPHPADMQESNMGALDQVNHCIEQQRHGLAVACLVEDSNLPIALPHAQADHVHGAASIRERKVKNYYVYILLSALLAVVIVAILLMGTRSTQGDDLAQPKVTSMTATPSLAPASVEDYILALLPEDTVSAIQDPDSPQSLALQWLLADEANLPAISGLSVERIKQRFALATLYFSTKGDRWVANNNWLNYSVHECDWYIKPDFAEKGTHSSVTPSFLAGFFPESEPTPSLCGENGLFQHLWLDQNNLDGTIPEELYMLTSLKSLSLGANRLEGTISTRVGQLTSLEGLVIKKLKSAGPIPSEIGILASLRALILYENDHFGLFPAELWHLTNLETFFIGEIPKLNGTIPSEITQLSNLTWISVHGTGFSGTIPSEIARLENLSWLALPENQFSGMLPTELGLLSKLTLLSVHSNELEGSFPRQLDLLSSLELLALRDNTFIGPIPSELGLLTNLTMTLNLKNNQFSSTIPTELGKLINLAELELSGNQLTGQIPSEFGHFTRMGKLTFANNSLTGTVPQELSSLWQSLHTLSFEGNGLLSGIIPEALCTLNGTCVSSLLDWCESNYGLSFDCTSLLCGCDCSCSNGA